MSRIFTQLKHLYFIFLLLLCSHFFSCAYFNTFYNAENSYRKALIIIEESPILEDDKFPTQAKKLLGEAIENSKVVLKQYPMMKDVYHTLTQYCPNRVYLSGSGSTFFLPVPKKMCTEDIVHKLRDYVELSGNHKFQ
mgnify:CR=1 FL=1